MTFLLCSASSMSCADISSSDEPGLGLIGLLPKTRLSVIASANLTHFFFDIANTIAGQRSNEIKETQSLEAD